ncbi:hypothetical protein ITP53_07355 [Nonomuraea sp. K274]|uniref:Secreted protein n=1 Tax=Nonomuraea cypriaca TaxID=1187855 RepID=A0A931EVE2_9ACTN|nr:hypothetical protein [Nonomuraea cypriaca]MBF8185554.1 hypothetical protein [Nonomuraea cypriaca]
MKLMWAKTHTRIVAVSLAAVAAGFGAYRMLVAQADSESPATPAVHENDKHPSEVEEYWTEERMRDATGG